MIQKGFETLQNNLKLSLYPILTDLLTLVSVLLAAGYQATSQFSVQLSLNPGLPSVFSILEDDNATLQLTFGAGSGAAATPPLLMLLSVLFSFLLFTFIEGGFISLLYRGIRDEETSFQTFLKFGRYYWTRFIGLLLFIMILSTAAVIPAFLMGGPGLILFGIGALIVRILFIYVEYTIVVDDVGVIDSLPKAYGYFKQDSQTTIQVLLPVLGINLLFGFLLNQFPYPVIIAAGMILYGFIMTGFMLSLMHTFNKTRSDHPGMQPGASEPLPPE